MKSIPTLLTTTKDEFVAQMDLFQRYYDRIQLDIADGIHVPNTTVSLDEMIDILDCHHNLFLPHVAFDFHLMVVDYLSSLKKIHILREKGVKVNLCLINAKYAPDIQQLKDTFRFAIGLDIAPTTQISDLVFCKDLNLIDGIQVMTVNPGFQGSPFLPEMLMKIEQLRIKYYTGEIMIDGGVNEKTIPLISSYTHMPDLLCIGSYLTKAEGQLEQRIQHLKDLERM